MFRKLSLALVLAALATGPAWAQFGAKGQKVGPSISPVVEGDTGTHEVGRLKGHRTGIQGQKAKGSTAVSSDGSVKGITLNEVLTAAKGKPVGPNTTQQGIIAVLIGLAKDQKAPAAMKSAVPGHPTLKDQIKGRMKSRLPSGGKK